MSWQIACSETQVCLVKECCTYMLVQIIEWNLDLRTFNLVQHSKRIFVVPWTQIERSQNDEVADVVNPMYSFRPPHGPQPYE